MSTPRGEEEGPREVPGEGRYAVLSDPQGAVFAIFHPSNPGRFEPEAVPAPLEISWRELATTDRKAATDFYSTLFGWQRQNAIDMGEPVGGHRGRQGPDGPTYAGMPVGPRPEGSEYLVRFRPDGASLGSTPRAASGPALPVGCSETHNADLDAEYAVTHPPARPGRYVALVVTDAGSGMDPATQARIFEPFFSTKGVGKGRTGLGLATVYGIVKQSDGYIGVYSEAGVGTTFKIYLPRVDDEAAAIEPQQEAGPLLRGTETVLLVEDEASLREMLRETLEANGYSVLVAQHGAEALQIAEAHGGPIQIMVTDVIMPGMTGSGLVDLLAPTRSEMKVLFVSGYSDESVTRHGLVGPGRAFLSKPFGPEVLLRKVRDSLDAA